MAKSDADEYDCMLSGLLRKPVYWACGLLIFILPACFSDQDKTKEFDILAHIKQQGEIVFLTRNAQTSYYLDREGYAGFEYELATSFAEYLGVKPRFFTVDSTTVMLNMLRDNEGHIAAAGLTRTPERERIFTFGPDYYEVHQQVICRRRGTCWS